MDEIQNQILNSEQGNNDNLVIPEPPKKGDAKRFVGLILLGVILITLAAGGMLYFFNKQKNTKLESAKQPSASELAYEQKIQNIASQMPSFHFEQGVKIIPGKQYKQDGKTFYKYTYNSFKPIEENLKIFTDFFNQTPWSGANVNTPVDKKIVESSYNNQLKISVTLTAVNKGTTVEINEQVSD